MTSTYERYLKLNIDSSRVGLEHGESESSYFCALCFSLDKETQTAKK